jgi:hypothetical protein
MLAGIRRLLERNRWIAFHDKPIEILGQKDRNGFRQASNDPTLDPIDLVQDAKGAVLKNRVGV